MGQDGSDFNGAMARRRGTGATVAIAALASIGLVAGCGDDRPTSTGSPTTFVDRAPRTRPTTTLPDLTASDGLAASIRQFREDEAAGVIQIEMVREPGGEGLVAVTSVRLDWPGFEAVPPTVRPVQVAPGQRVDLPTPLGAVTCATADTPSFSLGAVEVTVDPGDGTARTVRAPLLADAQTALDNVWRKACVRQRLLDRVGLEYSAWARSDPDGVPSAAGSLVVTRRDTSEALSVTGVDGSVLLFVNWTAPPPTLPSDERQIEVPIVVTGAGRCDGHALSDSKKTYVFQVQVRVGDEEPVGVDLPVPDADRPILNQIIVDTCGSDHRR